MGSLDSIRSNAKTLFATIGVSRVVVVDDEYAYSVERLLGICSELSNSDSASLPHMACIDFAAPEEVRSANMRSVWDALDTEERRETLEGALHLQTGSDASVCDDGPTDSKQVDIMAATRLKEVLGSLGDCEFVPLSLKLWEHRCDAMLACEEASTTLFLFDRGYSEERAGTDDDGFKLIREVQNRSNGLSFCGLITHTVPVGEEYDAWEKLATENELERDRFVVVSKGRLNSDPPDYYGFLAMVRLAALSGRYAQLKSKAWEIVKASLDEVKSEIEKLPVLDFDRIVFASSRTEGVWEPETLFRVLGILMWREAGVVLHSDSALSQAVSEARNVSEMPLEISNALDEQREPSASLRMQRFELYENGAELNAWSTPIGLGDIFRISSSGKDYILLGQPCDLVVRTRGLRNYEGDRMGLTVAVAEISFERRPNNANWGKLPFDDEDTGASAFASFGRVHQVQLAVLDLCVFRSNGVAVFDVDCDCPERLIKAWQNRHNKLKKYFGRQLIQRVELANAGLAEENQLIALADASSTLKVNKRVCDRTVAYETRRVMRLRQPWSAALLTEFAQYRARAAFDHYFGESVEAELEDGDD